MKAVAPLLVLGWGNLSRGDDALGVLLVQQLEQDAAALVSCGVLECLIDHQLQVEHALDLAQRQRVLFVDAAPGLAGPFEVRTVQPRPGRTPFTHALEPAALLDVAQRQLGLALPVAKLLALRAQTFELGQPPSPAGMAALQAARAWALRWVHAQAAAWPAGSRGSV
ncbi:MAG: hydrogenase maturation protease [Tepidimonas sp.]|nr:hydrogenase maturation protease [Tepidimonas sp.]